ncbi:MAG: LegC family aminotransferase [Bacteroidales bacterium]|jgi:aminotransferase in exopolysaccharide biosynthesis|nr:LegC family aminotransferase [Bacteroidales bacterium]
MPAKDNLIAFIRSMYGEPEAFIPLHEPRFIGNEKKYLSECIDTNFVSSVGEFVDRFEQKCAEYTGAKYAVAAMNGTSALHIALKLAGVQHGDEVITQALTFIATANAITYTGAEPVFIDVDRDTMGLSPAALNEWLQENVELRDALPPHNIGQAFNKKSGRRIAACIPMHTFGHPARLDELKEILDNYSIPMIEDAAESIGSYYKGKHTGTFGYMGILSFNGNKVITTGGGGMILTDNEEAARAAKHLTTQAKVPHEWEYKHDRIAYNYRLTNIAAALGCAQMETLDDILIRKRRLAENYRTYFRDSVYSFFDEPDNCQSNYWLNSIMTPDRNSRDELLEYTNKNGVMTRPVWEPMNKLPMFNHCQTDGLENTRWLADGLVNVPSSAILD